jgi:acyl dehydratase
MTQKVASDPSEAYAGKDLGSREFVCTERILGDYLEGLRIDSSRYADGARTPWMILSDVDGGFPGTGFKNNFGNLWMRQEWDSRIAIAQGAQYTVTSTIEDIYEWRGRTVVKQIVNLWSPAGELMAQGTHHQSYLLNQSSGKVKLRDPKKKEGARKFAVPDGERIPTVDRTIDLEMCGLFFHGNRNYHTDKRASEELGFEEVVVGGKMTMSLIGEMLETRFGDGLYEGGKLDIKFTNIVWPSDHVTAKGVITDRVPENGSTRAELSVWMEKDDGTVVIVGTASALE